MSDIQGNSGIVLVRTEFGFERQSGQFVQKTWEGTQDAVAGGLATIGNPDSYLMSPTGAGAKWQLVARYGQNTEEGGSEVPTTEERLRFNRISKSIFASPRYAAVAEETKRFIEANANDDDVNGTKRQYVEDTGDADALLLWDLVSSGVKEEIVYQPVVIVTDTASADFPWTIGFNDYGKIFTTAGMIADADLNSGWASNLPAETSPDAGFVFGWLKSPPEIVTAGGNRSQLVQEYEYGLWSLALYDEA